MKIDNTLAPICLFVYSRLDDTKLTVESLQKNTLAQESQLFIFSDGIKNNKKAVNAVRDYIHTINGFAKVTIYESEVNKGLANSIISGVTKIISIYNKVIVLEDDLILSTNFLCFMNQSLTFYEQKVRILSISGYAFDLKYPTNYKYDVSFSLRACSWGWATWKDRWEQIDWEVKSYSSFRNNLFKRYKFNDGGSDMSSMLDKQIKGEINSWAIRFNYHQYEKNLLDVFPTVSKVINIGFGENSTNTKKGLYRYRTTLDTSKKSNFNMQNDIKTSLSILLQSYWHYSLIMRALGKIVGISDKIMRSSNKRIND